MKAILKKLFKLRFQAGRWPWKSESTKECVTTHLPNQLALKMDGAGASGPYPAVSSSGRDREGQVPGGKEEVTPPPIPPYPRGRYAATSRRAAVVSLEV